MKAIHSSVLSILFMALFLNACASDPISIEPASTTSVETETTEAVIERTIYPKIPEGTDFGKYEFRILGYNGGYGKYYSDYISESETGEVISDAIYYRNRAVEEALNIHITAEENSEIYNTLRPSVMAGDESWDLIFTPGYEFGSALIAGCYAELTDHLTLQLTAPWYDANFVDTLTINGRLYGVNCDISTGHNNETSVYFYNKMIAEEYDLGDLYEIVRDGKWTVDRSIAYAKMAAKDINGDGTLGDEDIFGIVGNNGISYIAFVGMGGTFVSDNGNGLELTFGTEANISRMIDVFDRFGDHAYVYIDNYGTLLKGSGALFSGGQSLFYISGLGSVHSLRNADVDFGILPIPKEDESGERYYNNVNYWINTFMSVPCTVSDPERTSLIVDVLAAESYYTLRPAYYEIALKVKYTRDDASAEMLDMIFDNRVYDPAIQYSIGNLVNDLSQMFADENKAIASTFEKKEKQVKRALESFLKSFESLAD